MWARIPVDHTESAYVTKRPPSVGEIEWMVFAAIGAGFKGIVWVEKAGLLGRLKSLQSSIEPFADELGTARHVKWGKSLEGHPISMIRSERHLFVVILNTMYLAGLEEKGPPLFPIASEPTTGRVSISPPTPLAIRSGKTLDNTPITLNFEDDPVLIGYSFKNGGEMLIFELTKMPAEKQ